MQEEEEGAARHPQACETLEFEHNTTTTTTTGAPFAQKVMRLRPSGTLCIAVIVVRCAAQMCKVVTYHVTGPAVAPVVTLHAA